MDSFDFGSMLGGGGGGGGGKQFGRSEAHATNSKGNVNFGSDPHENFLTILALAGVGAVLLIFAVAFLSKR